MDSLVISTEGSNLFLEVSVVHSIDDFRKEIKKIKGIREISKGTNLSSEQFYDQLSDYEKKHKRTFNNSNYKNRVGMQFVGLLPKGDWDDNTLKKVCKYFAKEIIQKEKGLVYIAYVEKRGNGLFLRMFISDREVYEKRDYERYAKNVYRNKETLQLCGAKDPLAELVCKKGDIKLDEDGKPIMMNQFFKSKKSRRFVYKDAHWEDFIATFKLLFIQALRKVKAKMICAVYFTRINLKRARNRFIRRSILALNSAMQLIQNELNLRIYESKTFPDAYQVAKDAYDPNERIDTPLSKKFLKLFEEFKNIFKSSSFNYQGIDFSISLNERCDQVENNTILLKKHFEEQLAEITA